MDEALKNNYITEKDVTNSLKKSREAPDKWGHWTQSKAKVVVVTGGLGLLGKAFLKSLISNGHIAVSY